MNAVTTIRPPLRVALFSGNYDYVRDGANQALNRWVDFLKRQGATVRVYSPTGDKPAFEHAGTLVSVPSVAIPRRPEYRFALGLPKATQTDLEAFHPNIIHLSAPDLLGYRALKLAEKWHVPAVASVHTRFETYFSYYGMSWLEKYAFRYLRSFYGRCKQIYAPTNEIAQILKSQGMCDNVGLWGRGVDGVRFTPTKRDQQWRASLGIQPNEVVVLFVGRLVLEKGLKIFADALDNLAQRGIAHRALVVGEGPEREWFKARLPGAIFTGFLQGDDLARAYASSDIFFNPSLTETFGNVTLEAMASGLPSVCATATGSVTLVNQGVTGLLAQTGLINEYSDHLAGLIMDSPVRLAMGEAARLASQFYVWDNVMMRLLEYFQDIVTKF